MTTGCRTAARGTRRPAGPTHPDYVDADWPLTYDYGLLYLDAPVRDRAGRPACTERPEPDHRQQGPDEAALRGRRLRRAGPDPGGGRPQSAITWTRKIAVQRYAPGNGGNSALLHRTWFIVNNQPSSQHGGACGGDSGSPVLFADTDTVVAVHTGGYRLGVEGEICGRITSLNHRVDLPDVLAWIGANTN